MATLAVVGGVLTVVGGSLAGYGGSTPGPPSYLLSGAQTVRAVTQAGSLAYTAPVAGLPPRGTLANTGPTLPESGMKVINGNMTITTNDYVLENTVVNGQVTVRADRVKIRQCILRALAAPGPTKMYGVKAFDLRDSTTAYTGLEIDHVAIEVPANLRSVYHGVGIVGGNITVTNTRVSGYVDSFRPMGSNGGVGRYFFFDTVYLADHPWYDYDPEQTDGAHPDAIQDQGGTDIEGRNFTIYGGRTSAILIQQTQPTPTGWTHNHKKVLLENGYLDLQTTGGAVINISESGKGPIHNLTLRDLDFGRTDPTRPRIIMPNTTKNASTTVLERLRYADNGADVAIAVGG